MGALPALPCGGLLILDLPALGYNPIDLSTPDADYDLVFYERKLPSQNSDYIELDSVSVEIGTGPSGSCATSIWYTGFNWGDYVVTNNGHLGNTFPEIDNQEIPTSFLYGSAPLQTGIAIDLDSTLRWAFQPDYTLASASSRRSIIRTMIHLRWMRCKSYPERGKEH